MKRLVLQGDSITDFERNRQTDKLKGQGYAMMFASRLEYDFPGKIEALNRGVGGNRVIDIYNRIKTDIIDLKPDYLTILIGVNDVWHEYDFNNGIDNDKYFLIYSLVIEEIQKKLPDTKIYILGSFITMGKATEKNYDEFRKEVELRAESAKKIAEKYGLTYISLQDKFDKHCEIAAPEQWTFDGVHPTVAGHQIIYRTLMDTLYKDIEKDM